MALEVPTKEDFDDYGVGGDGVAERMRGISISSSDSIWVMQHLIRMCSKLYRTYTIGFLLSRCDWKMVTK